MAAHGHEFADGGDDHEEQKPEAPVPKAASKKKVPVFSLLGLLSLSLSLVF